MADYEKSYQIDFNVDKAIKSVERLQKAAEKEAAEIQKAHQKMVQGIAQKAFKQYEKNAKDAFDSMAKSAERADARALKSAKEKTRKQERDLQRYHRAAERNQKHAEQVQLNSIRRQRIAAERSYRAMERAAKEAAREQEKAARRSAAAWQSFGRGLTRTGDYLTRRVSLPLAVAGGAAIKMAVDFRREMANVSTLMDDNQEKVEQYGRSAQEMAKKYGVVNFSDVLVPGLYQTISALGESTENIKQLDIATRAAKAGVSDVKSSITLLAGAANAYNKTSAESLQVTSDLAFKAVELGVTTYPEMAASMGKVTPLAADFKTSQEELFATIATGTKVGTETSEVVTQMASVYSAFLKPTEKLTEVAKKYGYESAKAMMVDKGFRQTLIMLNQAVDGNSEKMARMLKRKEANVLATLLLGGQSENYKKILDEMKVSAGATDEAFRKQTTGVNKTGFALDKARANIEVMSQLIGDRLLPLLERFIKAIEPIVDKLSEMSDQEMGEMLTAAKWAILLGPILKVSGGLFKVSGALSTLTGAGMLTGMSKLTLSFNTLLGALGPVVAALVAGAAAGKALKELVFDPMLGGFDTASEGADTAILNAQAKLRSGKEITEEDVNAVLNARENIKKSSPLLTPEGLISEFGPGESYRQQANRQGKQLDDLADRMMARFKEAQLNGAAAGPVKAKTEVQVSPTVININAKNADAKETARRVRKEIGARDKALKRYLEGAANKAAAAEQ